MQQKIDPSRCTVDLGRMFKHLHVRLTELQTIDAAASSPECWKAIQGDGTKRLARGDIVSLIAADGLTISDSHRVSKAIAGHVWLTKPLRIVKLEEDALFSDGTREVVPNGTGYSIRTVRDGRVEDKIYQTTEAAKGEVLRRQPKRAA